MSKLISQNKGLVKFFFLFLLLMLAFNYPILSIFNVPEKIGDLPLLYLYIFVAWVIGIALIALVFERHHAQRAANESEETQEVSNQP